MHVHVDIACCGTHMTVRAQLLKLVLSFSLVCPEDRPKSSASHVGPWDKAHVVIYLCLFILGGCRRCLCREKEPVLLPPITSPGVAAAAFTQCTLLTALSVLVCEVEQTLPNRIRSSGCSPVSHYTRGGGDGAPAPACSVCPSVRLHPRVH